MRENGSCVSTYLMIPAQQLPSSLAPYASDSFGVRLLYFGCNYGIHHMIGDDDDDATIQSYTQGVTKQKRIPLGMSEVAGS